MTSTLRFVAVTCLVWVLFVCWVALVAAHAEPLAGARRPLPVPSTAGGLCPSGYSRSFDHCVPNPNTTQQAVSKRGLAPCPSRTHESMQAFCIEERR
jgi:hypothetical protein